MRASSRSRNVNQKTTSDAPSSSGDLGPYIAMQASGVSQRHREGARPVLDMLRGVLPMVAVGGRRVMLFGPCALLMGGTLHLDVMTDAVTLTHIALDKVSSAKSGPSATADQLVALFLGMVPQPRWDMEGTWALLDPHRSPDGRLRVAEPARSILGMTLSALCELQRAMQAA